MQQPLCNDMLCLDVECTLSVTRFVTVLCFVTWAAACVMVLSSPHVSAGSRCMSVILTFIISIAIARALKTYISLVECL